MGSARASSNLVGVDFFFFKKEKRKKKKEKKSSRWFWKPMGSARASSNLVGVDFFFFLGTKKKKGVMRESNSRPLAPKARIIPLDQSPTDTKNKNGAVTVDRTRDL